MSEPANEAALVKKIVSAIHKRHPAAWFLKVVGSPWQMSGVPDILVCVNGLLIGMEVKHQKPGETEEYTRSRATPLQRIQIQKINQAGGMAGVVISVDEALDMIDRAHLKHGITIRTINENDNEENHDEP